MKKYTGLFLLALMLGRSGDDDSTPTPTPPVEEENPVAMADQLSAVQNDSYTFNRAMLLENDELVDNAIITSIDTETEATGEPSSSTVIVIVAVEQLGVSSSSHKVYVKVS